MTSHLTGTRDEWLDARVKLLEAEKEHTRRGDELARQRQELPWVRVEKDYRFKTEVGEVSFADLFRGRSQLLMYHFMLGPEYTAGCPSCSAIADGFNGFAPHLENHDVAMMAVSLAPIDAIQAYKRRMGWTFAWASSEGSDFNYDYNVSISEATQQSGETDYNYRTFEPRMMIEAPPERLVEHAEACGTDPASYVRQLPGMSAFALEDGVVYHTYSGYARSLDALWGMYQWLDRAPKGRNESGPWFRRRDEYGA
jgi:predicted dithiol-disulfide oxidoreductase (DUF899 family)